jgi:undecaprenyl-diphosphatase
MICATRCGDGWLYGALAIPVLLFGGRDRFAVAAASGTAAGLGILLFLLLKRKAARTRPCAIAEHCWARLLPPDQFSFPSGHSITAFAIAIPLCLTYPSIMPALMFCAASVAISRIVLGMHFLSDVIAGSLLGAAVGYLCWAIYQ